MYTELATIAISLTIYLILATGTYLIFGGLIRSAISKGRMLRRLRTRQREMREERKLERKLRQSLLTALGFSLSPVSFLAIISILFLTVFLMGSRSVGISAAFIISLAAASLPCLLIWIRLCHVRRRGSHEGERLVCEFLRQYRINNFNVYEALEKVVQSPVDLKVTGKLLSKLLYNLRSTGNPAQIREATDEFAYSICTNWSLMLAHDIYIAAEKGTNISLAVEDILIQLREARATAEERKRLNSESTRMTYIMVPLIYGVTILMAVNYLEVPMAKLFDNQFGTSEGLLLFFFIVFLFVVNIALIQLVINQRFDY